MRSGSGAVAAGRSGFFGFHYGGEVAVRRRVSAADLQNGSWSHFSVPPCGAVAVWRQLASTPLKNRSRFIHIKYPIDIKYLLIFSINLRALRFHGMLG